MKIVNFAVTLTHITIARGQIIIALFFFLIIT